MSYVTNQFPGLPNVILDNPYQQSVIQPMMNSSPDHGTVSLYIFSPKNIPQQVRRAHLYQFDPAFIDAVGDTVKSSLLRGDPRKNSFMYDSPVANTAIIPSSTGSPVNISPFSDLWSFLLILDITRGSNIPTFGMGTGMHIPFNTRCIYVGYCSDEPINPMNFGNGPTINRAATLLITHHTIINQETLIDNTRHINRSNTITDVDIIPNHVIQMISPEIIDQNNNVDRSRYLMTPDKLHKTTSFDEGTMGTMVYSGVEAMITPTINNTSVQAGLNSPRHHMSEVVNGISNAFMHTAGLMEGISDMNDQVVGVMSTGDVFEGSVETYFSSQSSMTRFISPIDPSKPITLGELDRTYPNMSLTDCRVPANSQWDCLSQEAPNLVNIYGSMLSTTIPALLAGQGLSQIAFRYVSRDVTQSFGIGASEGSVQLLNIASFIPLSDNSLQLKFQTFMHYLKFTVFPTLLAGGGDFDLTIYCSVAGTSLINLYFLDFPSIHYNNAFYESATSLGGILSPLVGIAPELQHNAMQLSTLINAIKPNNTHY